MNVTERLSLSLKLRELNALSDQLMEALIDAEGPLALVADTDRLHTTAAELLAQVVGMLRKPDELPFTGGNVVVDELAAERDRESQRAMAQQHNQRADDLERAS